MYFKVVHVYKLYAQYRSQRLLIRLKSYFNFRCNNHNIRSIHCRIFDYIMHIQYINIMPIVKFMYTLVVNRIGQCTNRYIKLKDLLRTRLIIDVIVSRNA